MLTNQNPKTPFVRRFFAAQKFFHQSRRTLERRFRQDAAVGMGLSLRSVCRTGADRCMKIGDGAMVSQGRGAGYWPASCETALDLHLCNTWNILNTSDTRQRL